MKRKHARVAAVVGAAALGVPLLGGVATAAPSHAKTSGEVSVMCDGQTYDAVTNTGNSPGNSFDPAITLIGHTVLIPVAFGPSSFTLTDSTTGEVIDTENDPGGQTKGNTPNVQKGLLPCSFTISETFVSDGSGGLTAGHTYEFSGGGTVTGWIPASK